ncbi:MAG TPA: serine/threonine-protein phosphatase, partial [Alphaproteobacteria bacterium]|nr:serine/threonine-protein phosphatase [Alphaproteobacteria bacterium]
MPDPKGAWTIAALTDRGKVRRRNEDYFGAFEPEDGAYERRWGILVVVADGMGGHLAGGQASRVVVDTLGEAYFRKEAAVAGDEGLPGRTAAGAGDAGEPGREARGAGHEGTPSDRLARAFAEANLAVFERVGEGRQWTAGTTCTAAVLFPDRVLIAHAGDSRAYLLRGADLQQLTHDHSEVGEMLREGLIDEREAMQHPKRNLVTRAVGLRETVKADLPGPVAVEPGDTLLLCSDGLTSMVPAIRS